MSSLEAAYFDEVAFIGAGRITTSLVTGLIRQGYPPSKLWLIGPNKQHLRALQQHLKTLTKASAPPVKLCVSEKINDALRVCQMIVLAVKPAVLPQVCRQIADGMLHEHTVSLRKPVFGPIAQDHAIEQKKTLKNKVIVSLAAGVSITQLAAWLAVDPSFYALVRAMPNTPSAVGCGVTGLYAPDGVSASCKPFVQAFFAQIGSTLWLDREVLLDVVTALSGSGPAYVFYWMKKLAVAAQLLGLKEEDALLLTKRMVLGAAQIAAQEEENLDDLLAEVASPGGTTASALKVLETYDFGKVCCGMLEAAVETAQRSAEIL